MEHSVIWHIPTNVKAPFKSGQIQPLADWSYLNLVSIFVLDCAAKGMQSTNVNTHKVRLFCSWRVEGISGLIFLDGNWERGWVSILQFYEWMNECTGLLPCNSFTIICNSLLLAPSCLVHGTLAFIYCTVQWFFFFHKFCHIRYIFFLLGWIFMLLNSYFHYNGIS